MATVKKRAHFRCSTFPDLCPSRIICYFWMLLVEAPKISPPGGPGWACTFSGVRGGRVRTVWGLEKMRPHKYGTDRDTRDSSLPPHHPPILQLHRLSGAHLWWGFSNISPPSKIFNVHRNHKMFTTKEEMVPAKRRKRPHLRRSRAIEGHCPKCHYCPRHQNKPPPKAFSHRAAFKLPITTSNQAFREYITYVSHFCIKCF